MTSHYQFKKGVFKEPTYNMSSLSANLLEGGKHIQEQNTDVQAGQGMSFCYLLRVTVAFDRRTVPIGSICLGDRILASMKASPGCRRPGLEGPAPWTENCRGPAAAAAAAAAAMVTVVAAVRRQQQQWLPYIDGMQKDICNTDINFPTKDSNNRKVSWKQSP